MQTAQTIQTLYEREPEPAETLPSTLADRYDGGLVVPEGAAERPYVLANFVSTLDGVVSFGTPGESGGGPISGESDGDHLVMGLLRARADAVIFGAGSLHEDSGHVRTPAFIYPALAGEYAAYRERMGRAGLPLNVVVSGSGRVDFREPTFSEPGLRVLIATTAAGAIHLDGQALPPGVDVRVVEKTAYDTPSGGVALGTLLALLGRDYGVRVALTEGGPRLLAGFVEPRLLDELFLTLSPQVAGRAPGVPRLALLEGLAFAPRTAPWGELVSLKRAGSHLLLRYRFHDAHRASSAPAQP